MKQAFLLGVYKNPEYVRQLILSLSSDKTNIYVHINKDNYETFLDVIDFFKGWSNVVFLHNIKVMWGGSTLLDSIKSMLKEALSNKDNQWFHLVTGQDILIKPLSQLIDFFDGNNYNNYVSYSPLPPNEQRRFNRFHLYDAINVRSKLAYRCLENIINRLPDHLLDIRKRLGFNKLYWGSGWWSLRRDAAEYILKELNESNLEKRLRHTFAPDEMIVQTLLLNAEQNFHVVNDNLRFMIWNGASGPKDLSLDDFDKLKETNAFFARKIDTAKYPELYHKINKELNKTEL